MGNKEVISVKPFKQITILEQLGYMAAAHRSVVCPSEHAWSKPRPAAVVLCLQARTVLRLIKQGLYIYTPKQKPKYNTWTPKRNSSKKCGA